ncbi:hypothetical protein [Embleya sp. AB8]|uniref:hypothetical protein n=1 Tax=Embleya sp. AB8 TaxID=3156304 RepID=UPI003C7109E0
MDLSPYVDKLCRELAGAAEANGDDAQALAERLIAPLASASRFALLSALSAAAEEISRELAPGSVDVRLRGLEPDFVVSPPPTSASFAESSTPAGPPPAAPSPEADEGGTARITLRLSEHVKPRIERAAGREGLSVNAWLVRVVGAALEPEERVRERRATSRGAQRYTGWVR